MTSPNDPQTDAVRVLLSVVPDPADVLADAAALVADNPAPARLALLDHAVRLSWEKHGMGLTQDPRFDLARRAVAESGLRPPSDEGTDGLAHLRMLALRPDDGAIAPDEWERRVGAVILLIDRGESSPALLGYSLIGKERPAGCALPSSIGQLLDDLPEFFPFNR